MIELTDGTGSAASPRTRFCADHAKWLAAMRAESRL